MYLFKSLAINFALLQFVYSIQIYITNTEHISSNATCEIDNVTLYPCKRLADLNFKLDSFNETLYITLLPGDYYVHDSCSLRFNSISNVYFNSWNNLGQVRVICDGGDFSLDYTNISIVSISDLEFYNCSSAAPIISILAVSKVNIKKVKCTNSSVGCVKVSGITSDLNISHCIFKGSTKDIGVTASTISRIVYISDTVFENNNFGSLKLCPMKSGDITLIIERCVFAHNKAGNISRGAAIIVMGSAYTLKINHCQFMNNSADKGGAVAITDYTIYLRNSLSSRAYDSCGAAILEGSNKRFELIIENCTFIHNSAKNGGVIYIELVTRSEASHSIVNSKFSNNNATGNGGAILLSMTAPARFTFSSHTYYVYLNNVTFDNNLAENGGALYLNKVNYITFINCCLSNNIGHCASHTSEGGALAIIQGRSPVINIIKTKFSKNVADIGGALWMATHHSGVVYITNSSFYGNSAEKFGGSLYATGFELQISHANFFENKAKLGGAQYLNNTAMNLVTGNYINNTACAGGAIYSHQSYIHIGMVHLTANKAFSPDLNSVMESTSVLNYICFSESSGKGGAIFVKDRIQDCSLNSCRLTWKNVSSLKSMNNSANLGSVLYGGMIGRCDNINSTQIVFLNSSRESHSHSAVSSDAIQFCFYNGTNTDCSVRSLKKTLHLGQSFEVSVACLDQVMQGKDCVITSQYIKTSINFGVGENIQTIKGPEIIVFHTYSDNEEPFGLLTLNSDIKCTEEKWSSLEVNVSIKACPLGFEKTGDRCVCDHRLLEVFKTLKCLIGNMTIMISEDGWFGYDESYVRIYNTCPLNYCALKKSVAMGSHPHVQCDNNRGGILCSSCISNYSLILGSRKCKNCSGLSRYNFIWMTLFLALAGVLLVAFLMLLKMTVSSGTLNGLILYANILSVSGLLDYRNCSINTFLRVFISWINLDLGIEVCFYSGMDVYQKTWLQFVFPFYIWFLVGIIILVSHYSSKAMKLMGMRNIEVLATLFLLSYTKLLKTIGSTLSSTMIIVSSTQNLSDLLHTKRVWLYDAHLTFLGPKHWPLFTFALLCLVLLFLPYTLLLLFGQCLTYFPHRNGLRWIHSPKLTTILDAYYAPYNKHCRYWTGLSLLLRCILFVAIGFSTWFWTVVSMIVLLLAHAVYRGGIYQKKVASILEIVYVANLGFFYLISLYTEKRCEALMASISVSFILFIGITVYHVYLELVRSHIYKFEKLMERLTSICKIPSKLPAELPHDNSKDGSTTTYIQLRESLIDN